MLKLQTEHCDSQITVSGVKVLKVDFDLPVWARVLGLPEKVGRFLMDFGFGALVDKFEEHFGTAATRVLLALLGLAAITVCFRVVVVDAVLPLIKLIQGIGGKSILDAGLRIVLALLVASVAGLLAALVHSWFIRSAVKRIISRADIRVNEVTDLINEAKRVQNDAQRLSHEAQEACNDLVVWARKIECQTGKNFFDEIVQSDETKK